MAGDTEQIAVVVMAYGTPRHADEILPYYTDIRRGRPPSDEQLADLTRRYEAIGGLSPLAELTEAQRDGIQSELDIIAPGRFRVSIGLKHASPSIESTVEQVAADGHRRIVGLVLAPHFSNFSVGQYLGRLREAAGQHGIEVSGVESWATDDALVEFLVDDLRARLAVMPKTTRVVFTAHSLPQRIVATGDPYPDEIRSTATMIADRLGIDEGTGWTTGWQSAGRTPEPWLGPDILDVIDELGADPEIDGLIVSACGFVADHLEVLYDLDIEAKRRAESVGLAFDRTSSVNATPGVMASLARRIVACADAEDR